MRRLLRNRFGLSEIVGTLMLVLIVVAAVTAFAAFEQSYQKQAQQERAIGQARSLESIKVLSVASAVNATGPQPGDLLFLNFTAASLSVNPSTVTGLIVDGHNVKNYTSTTVGPTGTFVTTPVSGPNGTLGVPAREELSFKVDVAGGLGSSLYDRSVILQSSQFVKLDIVTQLEDDFNRTFVPPTALAEIGSTTIYVSGSPVTIPVFDGTHSIQPGNDTIVSWVWNITAPGPVYHAQVGEAIVPYFAAGGTAPTSTTYSVTLTVTNSIGLVGVAAFTYKY